MTQEEKAKRYDEALEELRGLLESIHEDKRKILEEDITSIFPELQENEDERIRKELIGFLRNIPNSNYTCEEMALWLEKQGENHDDKYNITGIKSKHAEGKLGEMIKEIKSTNKAEPKFKNGQWIIGSATGNEPRQIAEITEEGYKTTYGGWIGFSFEEDIHLWTIKDAKAGDVLYSPKGAGVEGIFLIKGWEQVELTGKTLCSSIGYRVEENEIVVSGLGAIWWEGVVDPFYPATKEQRDKFEKAMTDAGYTFDFEREELKKIEDEIEIPFGAKDSELIEESYYIPKGFHAEIDDDKVVINKGEKPTWSEKYIADVFEKVGLAKIVREQSNDALTIALQDAMIELGKVTLQPKPTAWSEEDEEILNLIIARLQSHADVDLEEYSKEYDWLNSPKARSTWKPSDEQMDALQYVCRNLNPPLTDKLGWDSLKTLELLYQDLKKL